MKKEFLEKFLGFFPKFFFFLKNSAALVFDIIDGLTYNDDDKGIRTVSSFGTVADRYMEINNLMRCSLYYFRRCSSELAQLVPLPYF